MKITVELHCPSCDGREFDVPDVIESHTDYIGMPCIRCGHKLTEREVANLLDTAVAKAFDERLKG
jgi:uncharacterized Zn finger protein